MLKIKDNVDLKELEKYGFKKNFSEDTGELVGYRSRYFQYVYMMVKDRKLNLSIDYIHNDNEEEFYNLVFDLIKADLVEKVED